MMEKEAGGGRRGATQVNHQKVKWEGCLHNLSLQLVPPVLGFKGQGFLWVLKPSRPLTGELGLCEPGVLVAVGFLLGMELSPGKR